MSIRVQGKDFKAIRSDLIMDSYMISKNGNVRDNMKSKSIFNCCGTKKRFHHWLNDEEMLKFHESDYYKNNDPVSGNKEDFEKKINIWNF